MQPLPHRYVATAVPEAGVEVRLSTEAVPDLRTAAPAEFDGPGNLWSPETLLVGAAADCLAITFRGIARASGLAWTDMTCDAVGILDRVDGVMRFTRVDLNVHVTLPDAADEDLARRVVDKARRTCLITNSLNADVHLHAAIEARTIEPDGCAA